MRHICMLVCWFGLLLPNSYAQDERIYDDNPMQRRPLGVEESQYRKRLPTGGRVEEARIDPPNWWVDMRNPELQLLMYDADISKGELSITYPGVTVERIIRVANPNYLFVDLMIAPGTLPGQMEIVVTKDGRSKTYDYELQARESEEGRLQGLTSEYLVYLIMPDRFANGDPDNDSFADMNQVGVNRDKVYFRHGGDLQGIIDHLDYLEDLGVTAVWLNPILENNQPYESYHGYAITDHYKVDKRFGTNALYKVLVDECHKRGMKVVMDVIHNHTGDEHWFIRDIPTADWVHQKIDTFRRSNYRETVLLDPYVAQFDKEQLLEGWFDMHMPDLNQKNPFLATYLEQNAIWWNEFSGHDAYRIDTYFYPEPEFIVDWGQRLKEEYDHFSFFGETWVNGYSMQAQFTEGSGIRNGLRTVLPAVTDFQLFFATQQVLAGQEGWNEGTTKIYYTLAHDFLYRDAYQNVIFLDNHDVNRYFSNVKEDLASYKMGLAFLMTTRGIPMLYYGTEMLLTGEGGAFGEAGRRDFPGGWEDDYFDKFREVNRTSAEQEAFTFVRKLANYRKNSDALTRGKLIHFIPKDGCYVYFRQGVDETIMVVLNAGFTAKHLSTSRFNEMLKPFRTAQNVMTGEQLGDLTRMHIPARTTVILRLAE
ncbi:MAG: glycoside hydrolase family 13 protein [Saprospiraceae bacterium]|nr:glycoside hydrolase family 13 protein [Saprospiraceae bacterium]